MPRAQTGILGLALGTFFDYYVTYVVSAEVGMIQRWFERGLTDRPSHGAHYDGARFCSSW